MDTTTKRDEFLSLFDTQADAVEFKDGCLSIGDYLLPDHVIDVREGKCEPDAEYWKFLIDQADSPLPTFASAEEEYDSGLTGEDVW